MRAYLQTVYEKQKIAIVYMVMNQKKTDKRCLNYFYGNIEAADQQLSMILKKGVAENHLHKGVSRMFPSIWDSFLYSEMRNYPGTVNLLDNDFGKIKRAQRM